METLSVEERYLPEGLLSHPGYRLASREATGEAAWMRLKIDGESGAASSPVPPVPAEALSPAQSAPPEATSPARRMHGKQSAEVLLGTQELDDLPDTAECAAAARAPGISSPMPKALEARSARMRLKRPAAEVDSVLSLAYTHEFDSQPSPALLLSPPSTLTLSSEQPRPGGTILPEPPQWVSSHKFEPFDHA